MEPSRPEIPKDPDEECGQTPGDDKHTHTEWDTSEWSCSDEEQRRHQVTQGVSTNVSWSQRLLRAESSLGITFNPRLKWLFHGYSQDEEHQAEEGNFVVTCDLVSRSSTRLLQLQQALLKVALCRSQTGSAHVCVRAPPGESSVSRCYRTLRKLLEHRALLLLLHEYTRRSRLAAAYISRLQHLLEERLMRSHLTQILHSWTSFRIDLNLLSEELRVHLNHWPCLLSRIQSDPYLRCSVVQHTTMLLGIKQVLDSLGLQSLALVEQVQYLLLSAVAHTELDTVPRDVLEDIIAWTDSYNQATEEQRTQHSSTQLRTAVLHLAEMLAVHRAQKATMQLHCCDSPLKCPKCPHPHKSSSHYPPPPFTLKNLPHCYCQKTAVFNQCRTNCPNKDPNRQNHNCLDSAQNWGNSSFAPQWPPHVSALAAGQQGQSPAQLLFHLLVSSTDLGASLLPHTATPATSSGQLLSNETTNVSSVQESNPLWLKMHVPPPECSTQSINLQHDDGASLLLRGISCPSQTVDMNLREKDELENIILNLSVNTAHAQWDHVLCTALGSALKDKCLTDAPHSRRTAATSSQQEVTSATMKNFLLLFHILLKLHCSSTEMSVSCPVSLVVHRHSVDLALATVQLATVWVMSKSQHFLSSWSLNKFLLITQGDLAVLRESSEMLLCQMKSVVMTSSDCSQSTSLNHSHLLLRQQIQRLDQAVTQLQTFSSTVLNMFSNHCKRKSGQIFEQTMPPSSHWRPSRRTGFPSSSSDYVSVAAGSVIGQVLECVALLSDDAGVQALSITTTAFLEAWMEHILREKIKFSVQGALQLKQDFDTIREMIQSHEYGLSADLLQQLLSLRVFQQVDSAVMCLLQQPQSKPYLSSRTWLPFIRCCPAHSSTDSLHAAVGSSITNLRSVEAQECDTRTAELQGGGTSAPGEPYLAPSLTLDAAQQQWLDLRMSSSDHRWRMQRFRRLFNSNLNTHPKLLSCSLCSTGCQRKQCVCVCLQREDLFLGKSDNCTQ